MKRFFKALGITVTLSAIIMFFAGCPVFNKGIELGNYGGKTIADAYNLSDGEYVMGFLSNEEDSRWFSVPVVANQKFKVYFRGDNGYYVYYQSGIKIWNTWYRSRTVEFTSGSTGTWYFEINGGFNSFAIAYTTGETEPTPPMYYARSGKLAEGEINE